MIFLIDSLGSGGAERQVSLLSAEMQSLGAKVKVICFTAGHDFFAKELVKANIQIVYLNENSKSNFYLSAMWNLLKILKNEKQAILLPFLFKANLSCIFLKTFMGIQNKIICSERSSENAYKTLKLKFLRPIYLILSDKIVCNSYVAADEIKKKLFIRKSKVLTIWNGFNLPEVYVDDLKTEASYELLFVGRIIPSKNLHVIIDCLEDLSKNFNINLRLNVLGRVETGHENYYKNIKSKVNSSKNLSTHILFHGEVKNPYDYYKRSSVLILLSEFEGLPNVVCEALAHGCLIIASNISDLNDLVGSDRGFILPEISSHALCEAINAYLSIDEDRKRKMRRSAINFSYKHLGIASATASYWRLLQEVSQ